MREVAELGEHERRALVVGQLAEVLEESPDLFTLDHRVGQSGRRDVGQLDRFLAP